MDLMLMNWKSVNPVSMCSSVSNVPSGAVSGESTPLISNEENMSETRKKIVPPTAAHQ